jgi:hypothetical protein
VWHFPSRDVIPVVAHTSESLTFNTFTPITIADSHSPNCRLLLAVCNATSDEEQAVSVVEHGPCNPNVNETLPLATDKAVLVASYTENVSWPGGVSPASLMTLYGSP